MKEESSRRRLEIDGKEGKEMEMGVLTEGIEGKEVKGKEAEEEEILYRMVANKLRYRYY